MKITKSLLEKAQADAYDRAQVKAYRVLKQNPKAFAAIYAYNDGNRKIIMDVRPLIKYSQKEIQEFVDGFRNGKESNKVIIDILYRTQLDDFRDALQDRGLLSMNEKMDKEDQQYIEAGILGTDVEK